MLFRFCLEDRRFGDLRSVAAKAGYSYTIRAVGFFSMSDSVDDKDRERLVLYSALPMMISTMRGYLSEMTAHSVYGRYLLPSVDLARLLTDWQAHEYSQGHEKF